MGYSAAGGLAGGAGRARIAASLPTPALEQVELYTRGALAMDITAIDIHVHPKTQYQ
jgi:hypothetical protein